MILGRIIGSCTTRRFNFDATDDVSTFSYVQVPHKDGEILAQIVEITKSTNTTAHCTVLGLIKDKKLIPLRSPPDPGCEVIIAQDELIKDALKFEGKAGAYLGKLDGKDIPVNLDLNQVLQKHIAVLAKSGSGKSYTVGVLIEEVIKKGAPILIIDPHGEYHTLKYPNDSQKDDLKEHNLEPLSFIKNVVEYGDTTLNQNVRPIKLPDTFEPQELIHLLPAKLSQSQQAILYASVRDMDHITIDNLQSELAIQDGAAKWAIIAILDYLKKLDLFSAHPTPLNELITPGKASILNLRGIDPDVQQIIVTKLLEGLFQARKQNKIPPFFLIVEEAHNFCPERSFGEAKSSKILRTIASEGRKFGLGLCIVSQRPARVDKSVLSQCSTQIILRITNPGDVRAITNSLETITQETEGSLQNLPIGVAMVSGIAQMPIFCRIRPRQTKHGGEAASFVREDEEDSENPENKDFLGKVDEYNQNMIPLIRPKTPIKDLKLMHGDVQIKTHLIPAYLISCHDDTEYKILVERTKGKIVVNVDEGTSVELPDLSKVSPNQLEVLMLAKNHAISPAEVMIKLGYDFSSSNDLILGLAKMGFLEIDERSGKYIPAKTLAIPPSKFPCHSKIDFSSIHADVTLEPTIEAKGIKDTLERLTHVQDMQECFIVWHEVQHGNQEQDHNGEQADPTERMGEAHPIPTTGSGGGDDQRSTS